MPSRLSENLKRLLRIAVVVLIACLACGCQLIAPFSEEAYRQATSLKVESLQLMARANEPFSDHAQQVAALRTELEKAHEYAAGRPKNEHSTAQWRLLLDPERHLLGGFFKKWETDGRVNPALVREQRILVSDAFDHIIGLESGKIRPER